MEGQEEFNNVPEGNITIEQKESIKLTKNAKGNFQWEIKQLSLDIDALEKLNNTMKLKFGGDAQ
jgi:hypothetical protein